MPSNKARTKGYHERIPLLFHPLVMAVLTSILAIYTMAELNAYLDGKSTQHLKTGIVIEAPKLEITPPSFWRAAPILRPTLLKPDKSKEKRRGDELGERWKKTILPGSFGDCSVYWDHPSRGLDWAGNTPKLARCKAYLCKRWLALLNSTDEWRKRNKTKKPIPYLRALEAFSKKFRGEVEALEKYKSKSLDKKGFTQLELQLDKAVALVRGQILTRAELLAGIKHNTLGGSLFKDLQRWKKKIETFTKDALRPQPGTKLAPKALCVRQKELELQWKRQFQDVEYFHRPLRKAFSGSLPQLSKGFANPPKLGKLKPCKTPPPVSKLRGRLEQISKFLGSASQGKPGAPKKTPPGLLGALKKYKSRERKIKDYRELILLLSLSQSPNKGEAMLSLLWDLIRSRSRWCNYEQHRSFRSTRCKVMASSYSQLLSGYKPGSQLHSLLGKLDPREPFWTEKALRGMKLPKSATWLGGFLRDMKILNSVDAYEKIAQTYDLQLHVFQGKERKRIPIKQDPIYMVLYQLQAELRGYSFYQRSININGWIQLWTWWFTLLALALLLVRAVYYGRWGLERGVLGQIKGSPDLQRLSQEPGFQGNSEDKAPMLKRIFACLANLGKRNNGPEAPQSDSSEAPQSDSPEAPQSDKAKKHSMLKRIFAFLTRHSMLKRIFAPLVSTSDLPEEAQRQAAAHSKALVELYQERMELSYSSIRYLVWAVPSIGFIGTVLGIGKSMLMADKIVTEVGVNQAEMLKAITNDLGVAFDTTLIALLVSVVLMLMVYMIQATEDRLLCDAKEELLRLSPRLGQEQEPEDAEKKS